MTNYSMIRKGVRALCVALLTAAVCAAWPLAAQAKGGNSHASISVTKSTDKTSPSMARKNTTTSGTVGRANFDVFTVSKGIDTATTSLVH